MVMPGDNITMTVKLICPIAMEQGLRFAIREGGHTVGAGVVAQILESQLIQAVRKNGHDRGIAQSAERRSPKP